MDTGPGLRALVHAIHPSMEPWPFSHGYWAWPSRPRSRHPPFNGAMALQPWIRRAPARLCQARHSFNGAMALQPWIPACPPPALPRPKPFNGAMALQPWILHARCHAGTVAVGPSMEPWPFSHGYLRAFDVVQCAERSFNGAMALQPWIPACLLPETMMLLPFNGAMALQPWIRVNWVNDGVHKYDLQWSHGPSAMDTSSKMPPCAAFATPSMEPWPFSHGYGQQFSPDRPLVIPFNGAMALQPWILGLRSQPPRSGGPSMEPWPFSHGYLLSPRWKPAAIRPLQWSHGPSAMDTSLPGAFPTASIVPSMEPWPFSHGYGVAGVVPAFALVPSMEPWPFSHGYGAFTDDLIGAYVLQWSHGPSAMDTAGMGGFSEVMSSLQWSHGPSAMDTCSSTKASLS